MPDIQMGVLEGLVGSVRVYREGRALCEVLLPGNLRDAVVELVGVGGANTGDDRHDARGDA